MLTINKIKKTVSNIAENYPVNSIDLFGSYAEKRANNKSDIDLLVYFDESVASLLDMCGLRLDLQDNLKVSVDVVAAPLSKDSILNIKEMVRIYER